jgi:hypothetical protein
MNRYLSRVRRLSAAAALSAVALAGCSDFIDPNPTDVLAPENFYKTSADAVAAVNGVYEQVKWMHWLGYWYMSDVAADDIIATPNFGSDGHRMADYIFDSREWPLGDVWGSAYTVINRANAVVDRVPAITMDETLKNRLVGEARFLRALAYFTLVRFYGDVPLLEHEVQSLGDLDISRTPMADVYTFIVADLDAASTALPASYAGGDIGRVTAGAAKGLLAKVYLNQADYQNAARVAGEIINSGQYALLPNWKDNFSVSKELTNSESIFEINYDGTLDPGAGSVHTLFSLPAAYPGGDAYGLMQLMPSLVALYGANDQRGNHGTFMLSPYTDLEGRVVDFNLPDGAAFAKYLDETNPQNMNSRGWAQQNNNWIILRYADVLLMYAEAVNEGGTATGMSKDAALNAVRTRAGIGSVNGLAQDVFRDSLRTERRREFVFEGQRWFDLSRWGILDAAIMAKTTEIANLFPGETTPHGVPSLLMPLPQSQLDLSSKLTQNPGR